MNQMAANASEEVVKEKPFFNPGGNLTGMVSMKVSAEFLNGKSGMLYVTGITLLFHKTIKIC